MTPEQLAQLEQRKGEIVDELKAINEAAGDAELDGETAKRWEALEAEHRDVVAQIEEQERIQRVQDARKRWGSVQVGTRVEPFDEPEVRRLTPNQARDRSRKLLEERNHSEHLEDYQREHVEKVVRTRNSDTDGDYVARLILATHNEHYRSAFMKRVLVGEGAYLTPEEGRALDQVRELRAMSTTSGNGGYAIPSLIDPTVVLTGQGSPDDILRLARVETITNNVWKGLSTAGMSWRIRAEAAEATDNSPSIAQPEVPVYPADGFIPFSYEIDADWPGFRDAMADLISSGYRELVVNKVTTGTGTSATPDEPTGIVAALSANTNVQLETTTSGAIAPADVYKLWELLPARYKNAQAGARTAWMSSTNVSNQIRQFGTTDPNFTINLTAEGMAPLFGRPYPLNDYMASVPSDTTASVLLIVGDWRNFLIAQRAGMSVELVQHTFGSNGRPKGERGLFAYARFGSDSINDLGFRALINNDGT